MDMTKIVGERVSNLRRNEASLDRMRERIQTLEYDNLALKAAATDAPHVSGNHSGRSEKLDNNLQEIEYLKLRIKAVENDVRSLCIALESLPQEQQTVLDLYYLQDNISERGIMEEMHVDRSTAYRKRNQALRDLAHALYGGIDI